LDCKTGKRGKVQRLADAVALVQKDRLVTVDDQRGLTIWDLAKARKLATLPSMMRGDVLFAASPDDRWLLGGTLLWDLTRREPVLELAEAPDSARFIGSDALLTANAGRVTIRRAPTFDVRGTLLVAHDLSAAIVFAEQSPGTDPTLEVLGAEDAWDSTFTCGVANQGVPFRVCRQAFTQPGLLEQLLR
jgi:hypothetical protein